MEKGQLSPSGPGSVITANKNPAGNKKAKTTGMKFTGKATTCRPGPGVFGYSLDAVSWIDFAEWWHPRLLVRTDAWDASSLCHLPWSSLLSSPPSTRLAPSSWLMSKFSTRGNRKEKDSLSPMTQRHTTLWKRPKKKKRANSGIAIDSKTSHLVWYYLVSLLFWKISICYTAFVEGFMCPPKHFPNTPVSAPSLPPFPSLVCQKFSHPATAPRPATPSVGVRVRHASGLCSACRASLDGRREVFVSYGNTRRETQSLINYMAHLHIHVVRHYVNTKCFA